MMLSTSEEKTNEAIFPSDSEHPISLQRLPLQPSESVRHGREGEQLSATSHSILSRQSSSDDEHKRSSGFTRTSEPSLGGLAVAAYMQRTNNINLITSELRRYAIMLEHDARVSFAELRDECLTEINEIAFDGNGTLAQLKEYMEACTRKRKRKIKLDEKGEVVLKKLDVVAKFGAMFVNIKAVARHLDPDADTLHIAAQEYRKYLTENYDPAYVMMSDVARDAHLYRLSTIESILILTNRLFNARDTNKQTERGAFWATLLDPTALVSGVLGWRP